jgi:hypothetical protein
LTLKDSAPPLDAISSEDGWPAAILTLTCQTNGHIATSAHSSNAKKRVRFLSTGPSLPEPETPPKRHRGDASLSPLTGSTSGSTLFMREGQQASELDMDNEYVDCENGDATNQANR